MITTKMFKNINYNNVSQKRLAKFALIKYCINFRNYGIRNAGIRFIAVQCIRASVGVKCIRNTLRLLLFTGKNFSGF